MQQWLRDQTLRRSTCPSVMNNLDQQALAWSLQEGSGQKQPLQRCILCQWVLLRGRHAVEIFNQVHINSMWIFHLNYTMFLKTLDLPHKPAMLTVTAGHWKPGHQHNHRSLKHRVLWRRMDRAVGMWRKRLIAGAVAQAQQPHREAEKVSQGKCMAICQSWCRKRWAWSMPQRSNRIEQAWCLPVLSEALIKKVAVEEELHQLERDKVNKELKALETNFWWPKLWATKKFGIHCPIGSHQSGLGMISWFKRRLWFRCRSNNCGKRQPKLELR